MDIEIIEDIIARQLQAVVNNIMNIISYKRTRDNHIHSAQIRPWGMNVSQDND
jgi:hypothetical protein